MLAPNRLLSCIFFILATVFLGLPCCDGHTVTLAHGAWKGVVGYIPVDRQPVQEKLDFYNANQGSCGGPLLYLPRDPVFPEILSETQHVLYIDFGTCTVYDCEVFDPLDSKLCPSLSRPEVALSIPLLSNSFGGVPMFSLALNIFYPRNRSNVPNINFMHHFVPVDEILLDDSEAILRDGKEELRLFVNRQDTPCQPATPSIRRQLGKRMEELQLGFPQPDFSSCEYLQKNSFCSVADGIKDDVHFLAPNICQTAWGPPTNESCLAFMEVLSVTPGIRERLFFGSDDPIHFIASETYDQYFDVRVKFPCMHNVRTN